MDRFAIAFNCTYENGSADMVKKAMLRDLELQEENIQYFFQGVNLGLNQQETMPDITWVISVDRNKSLTEEKIKDIMFKHREISLKFIQRM